jgi:VanZ family protein
LPLVLIAVVLAMALAAFWPLDPFPRNEVKWLPAHPGVALGTHSIIRSRSPLQFTGAAWTDVSLELWIRPYRAGPSTVFLSIYSPTNTEQLRLMQFRDVLMIRQCVRENSMTREVTLGADDTVYPNALIFATITSGVDGTSIYLNGKLARSSPQVRLNGRTLSGELIFGTSPFDMQTWQGEWLGFAVYPGELTAASVLAHYQQWTSGHTEQLEKDFPRSAVYDFHERTGGVIHSLATAYPDLIIPHVYSVPHKAILRRPDQEYRPTLSYWTDVAVNIAGFTPLGSLLYLFFATRAKVKNQIALAVVIGGVFSLMIEVIQGYLPQRSSGITDIVTNTAGTAIGAILGAWWLRVKSIEVTSRQTAD